MIASQRRPVLLVGVLCWAAAVTACAAPTNSLPAKSPLSAEPEPPAFYAMTGLPAPQDWRPKPVVVVKVDNTTAGRPQLGVGQADLVIEEPVEGGLTRLAAFFESNLPESVGPVRSVRLSDIGLVKPVRATVVASGGAPDSLAGFQQADVDLIDENSPALARDPNRAAPYNLYVDLTAVDRRDGQLPRQPYLDFGTPKLNPGPQATSVTVTFSPSRTETWTWNGSNWSQPDSSFRPKTLIVLRVRTRDTGERDAAGSPIPEVITTGGGRGFLLSNGTVHPIRWEKNDAADQWQFTTEAGLVIQVPPGRTWLSLIERTTGSFDYR